MSIFGKDVDEAADKMQKATIKAAEFEGKGLVIQFKSVEKKKSQYGAEEDSSIVEKGILEEGEQFVFKFVDAEGDVRTLYTTSMPLFIGLKQVEFNEDDWLHIRREGSKAKTRYYVEVVEAPANFKESKKEKPKAPPEIDPDDIPF